MGQPKLKKKKYSKPTHPWQKERLEAEKELLREFGLKNKEEVWKVSSLLRKYAKQAKTLIALNSPQAEIERAMLLKKLISIGIIQETAKLEDVLIITMNDILSRRLQTILYKNGLAKSIRQARQFITHEHVNIGDKKITFPSYIVSKEEELLINFAPNSSLVSPDHPERAVEKPSASVTSEKKKDSKGDKGEEKKEEKPKTDKKEAKEEKTKKEGKPKTDKKEAKEEETKKEEKLKTDKKEAKDDKKEEKPKVDKK